MMPMTPDVFKDTLRIPLIVAPMFLVSTPAMVVAACRAGVCGSVPSINQRTSEGYENWLRVIEEALDAAREAGERPAPYAVNLIMHKSNTRLEADLAITRAHRVPIIIASVGNPEPALAAARDYGGLVFADVASIRHAQKAAQMGVDGMVLLTAGAGGQTGWLNPFAFVAAVREFYDGLLIVAGSITQGRHLRAIEAMGGDMGYPGTVFIPTKESSASQAYHTALIEAGADDVMTTAAVTGIPANMLKASLSEHGFLRADGTPKPAEGLNIPQPGWKETVFSAGHGVGAVQASTTCLEVVDRFAREYADAGQ